MELIVNYTQPELKKVLEKRFMDYYPSRFERAIRNKVDKDHKEICYWLDVLEFDYRHYIIGIDKNLRKVNLVIKLLNQYKLYKREILNDLLNSIEMEILHFELYELMQRHKTAIIKITKR